MHLYKIVKGVRYLYSTKQIRQTEHKIYKISSSFFLSRSVFSLAQLVVLLSHNFKLAFTSTPLL